MESCASTDWLDRREYYRDELYGEVGLLREEGRRSLGGIALNKTFKGGSRHKFTPAFTEGLYENVHAIMRAHNTAALSGAESLYAMTSSEATSRLAGLAVGVMTNWER